MLDYSKDSLKASRKEKAVKAQPSLSAQHEPKIRVSVNDRVQGILIGFLAIGFILLQLVPATEIETLVSFIILSVIIWVLPGVRGSTLVISLFLLITAVALMLYHRVPGAEWIGSMRINLTLVAIFLLVPLLGIPVKTGGYVEALKMVLSKKMNEPHFFYLGTKLLTHVLAVVLNIGAVSIVSKLTEASNIKSPRLVANAINRGFVSTIFWSPYFSAMALILSQLPIKWSSIVLYAIGLSVISLLLSFFLDRQFIQANIQIDKRAPSIDEVEMKAAKKKVAELFIYLFVITAAVLLLEFMTSAAIVLMICLVSLGFPLLWCLLKGKGADYFREFKGHLFFGIPRMKKEIVLFLIAGFFSGAFVHSNMSGTLVGFIQSVFGSFHLGAAFFLAGIVFLTSLVGIHPIVPITIYVTSINPALIGFSPEYFAVLLLASWGVSNTVAPATAVNNLLANLLKVDLMQVSIHWNVKYVLIMLLIIPIYLQILGV